MPKTVEQIRQQIAKLQQQEKQLLDKEINGVVARIRQAVEHYQLTPEQIFGAQAERMSTQAMPQARTERRARKAGTATQASPRSKTASVPKGTKVAAKFRDKAGNNWSGRGSQPRWLRAALASGAKLEDFAIAET
jgi:DNA-binding protein H-NS